jgi:hypothetical protein
MTRLMIYLSEDERVALQLMAEREVRGLRDQARLLVRQELERSGLLQPQAAEDPKQSQEEIHVTPA